MKLSRCLLLLLLLLPACATSRPPARPVPGGTVTSLRSEVNVSLKTAQGEQGGRGYLIYRRPARFHLAMLSPFSTPIVELYANGEQLLIVYPGEGLAYAGRMADLPSLPALQGWRLLPWLVTALDLNARQGVAPAEVEVGGERCRVGYDAAGLVISLVSGDNQLLLQEYAMVGGVPLPHALRLNSRRAPTASVRFIDPEVGIPVDEQTLAADLAEIRVLPLRAAAGAGATR